MPVIWIKGIDTTFSNKYFFDSPCVVILEKAGLSIPFKNALIFEPPLRKEESILKSFFLREWIYKSVFHRGILYALVLQVPFEMTIVPKTRTFQALFQLSFAVLTGTFTVRECLKFRYFNRNREGWKKWHDWYPFVYELTKNSFLTTVDSLPSTSIAHRLKKLFNTSRVTGPTLIPENFYLCEITFDEEKPCGIMYQVSNFEQVTYVSPMVVSMQTRLFLDVNRQVCTHWMPLYKNNEYWLQHGVFAFARYFARNVYHLNKILEWLSRHQQTEKYRYITMDLQTVRELIK